MLSVKLNNLAIVVASDSNNPRLLNHDFLVRNKIVSKDWIVKDVLVTAPISRVLYDNGVQIILEENKLNVASGNPDIISWEKDLPGIATSFLAALPQVSYRAVGLNFSFLSDYPKGQEAEQELIDKFLKQGSWLNYGKGLTGVILEFQYRATQPQMNVKIGVLEKKDSNGSSLEGFIITAHFHHDFKTDETKQRTDYINSIGMRQTEFLKFLQTLPL